MKQVLRWAVFWLPLVFFFLSKGTFFAVSNLQRESTPRHTPISSVNRANPEKIRTTIWIFWISMAHIYICYSPAGRSELGEAVPDVLSTTRDRRPRAVLRPRAQFLPIWTDLGRWITFLFFFLLRLKSFGKSFLHSPTYVCWSRTRSCWWSARSIANQNKTFQHDS